MASVACITLSAKYNEKYKQVPNLHQLQILLNQFVSKERLFNYEYWAFRLLNYQLQSKICVVVTPTFVCFVTELFLSFFLSSAVTPISFLKAYLDSSNCSKELVETVHLLANLCILDVDFTVFQPSAIAVAIYYHARRLLDIDPLWTEELSTLTFHDPLSSPVVRRALVIIQQRYPDPRGGTITLVVVEDKPQAEFKIEIKKEVAAPESKKEELVAPQTTNVFKTSENKTEELMVPQVLEPLKSKTEELVALESPERKKEELVALESLERKKEELVALEPPESKTEEELVLPEVKVVLEETIELPVLETKLEIEPTVTQEEYKPKVDRFFCICRRRRFNY